MSDKLPKVSVVTPAYNEGDNIAACVNALKTQNFPKEDYEIIVVDNNSSDGTLEIVKNLGVSYTVEYKRGRSQARNAGIKIARGNLIAFVDAGCTAKRDWLSNIVQAFENSHIGCVAGDIKSLEKENPFPLRQYLIKKEYLSQKNTVSHPFLPYADTANAAYRKAVFDRIGLFDEKFKSGEDADLCWRMQLFTNYKIAYVSDAVVLQSYESRAKSLFKQKMRHAYWHVMLYKKYQKYREKEVKSLKQTYWEYYSICIRLLRFFLRKLQRSKNSSPVDRYQIVLETAWKVGSILGSLRHRVWYL